MRDSRETLTKTAFVTGYPIKHSRSPLIHSHWLQALGLPGHYVAHAVAPDNFSRFMSDLKDGTAGFVGGNVTIPHKESAYRLADKPDHKAEELGAANTLWLADGAIHATNTDGEGFTANLDDRCPGWDQSKSLRKSAVILGAGGAARAVIQAVRDRGFHDIHVVNRTETRAIEMRDRFGPSIHPHPMDALAEVMQDAQLFVNTTSLGMDGAPVPSIDFSHLHGEAVVTDIVYVPLITPILAQARQQGRAVVDGLGMLLHQAAPGFERWFGVKPDVDDVLRALVIADMDAHR